MESTSAGELTDRLAASIEALSGWMAEFGAYQVHPSVQVAPEAFATKQAELLQRLQDNYPFFHPRYIGQMLKPPHPAAIVGYLSAMLINPNNHALDGGPATARMEKEVVADLARMFGYPTHLGHLTSSGTIANLEALFIARESHPGKGIAYSADAHYTHSRMSHLLGMSSAAVPTDAGRPDGSRRAGGPAEVGHGRHRGVDRGHHRPRGDRPHRPGAAALPAATAPGSMSTPPTAASSP